MPAPEQPEKKPPENIGTYPDDLRYALELRYINYCKNAFIIALRAAFANRFTPEQYRYSEDKGKRQLSIYRAWVKRQTKYPCILVETEPGDFSISTLDAEEGYINDDPATGEEATVTCTGTMTLPIHLTVMALTPTDREKLTDLLAIYVRWVFRNKFFREGIPFLDIRAGEAGEDVDESANKVVFKGEVTIVTQTQFKQTIDLSCIAAVEALNFGQLLFGTTNDDLQTQSEV